MQNVSEVRAVNGLISAYEARLRTGAEQLEAFEQAGRRGVGYDRLLRNWLELLAAYEYEFEMAEAGSLLAAAV